MGSPHVPGRSQRHKTQRPWEMPLAVCSALLPAAQHHPLQRSCGRRARAGPSGSSLRQSRLAPCGRWQGQDHWHDMLLTGYNHAAKHKLSHPCDVSHPRQGLGGHTPTSPSGGRARLRGQGVSSQPICPKCVLLKGGAGMRRR